MYDNVRPSHKNYLKISAAQRRVLLKAAAAPVRISGGYECVATSDFSPTFDRRCVIDRLILAGLLTWGDGHNTYKLTLEGRERVARMRVPA